MGLLNGKKALIAGVANKRSIAWGIAQAFHAEGVRLALSCLEGNVRRLRKLAPEVNPDIIIPCEVQKEEDIARTFAQVSEVFDGKLDILVHSIAFANMDDLGGEFIKTPRSGWHLALDISAYSLVALARGARPLMQAAGGGSIMALTFGNGRVVPGYNIMGIAKAALETAVRYLAYDLGPDNIRVNAIESGPIATLSSHAVEDFGRALRSMEECSPLLRNVTPEEVGKTAVYLASDLSMSTTGSILHVDSGMNIMGPTAARHRNFREISKSQE
jgi:enoyl-[acyl-carrier protein] reductase I